MTRRFSAFLAAQALGAFNDNAFKTFVAFQAAATMPAERSASFIAAAGACFVAPFLLFSTYAGWVADRWSKKKLVVALKAAEVGLMALSYPALASGSPAALMALLFCLGTHSAFFGPVKLSIVPELVDNGDLSNANGLVQMTTFMAIIGGTIAAAALVERLRLHPEAASLAFVAAAALGLAAAAAIPALAPQSTREPLELNVLAQARRSLAQLAQRRGVFLATLGCAYFWFVGAIFQMNLLVYGTQLMGLSETQCGYFQIVSALGIGLGSLLAGRLSRRRVELGLVPLAALGLVVFSLDLAFAYGSERRAFADLLLLGVSAGGFVVPLQALIQQRTPGPERGKVAATGNLLSFAGVLVASASLWAFSGVFALNAGQVFLVVGLMTLVVALYIVSMLPDFLTRLLLYPLAHGFYKIRSLGEENVPLEGPALLISNHVSFIDAFLIAMSTQRMVRFMMFRAYYDLPIVGWFFRAMKCIPVSDRDGPKAIVESFKVARAALEAGHAVCIFAEGEISRHGQMLRFKKGFERVVDGLDVPIIPVHLDQVWGSIFSFAGGKVLFKRPRRLPYPVTVSFGKPLRADCGAFTLRQAILELGAEAFRLRLVNAKGLGQAFLAACRRHPFRLAVADSLGGRMTYLELRLKAKMLGATLAELSRESDFVGVLLPPSVAAAVANVGLTLAGKIPVNLNYTSSAELLDACRAKAGIQRVVTSRRVLEKLGWSLPGAVYIEDIRPRFLALLRRSTQPPLDSLATIMFTSGSTGIPKGVMLTQANILSNLLAIAQVYEVGPRDRLLGILPFFHAFGFTATLWMPLLSGMGVVYHYSPLDAKKIGELVSRFKCTFLMGTPTFLQNLVRRVEPAQFSSLRRVIVGAEKLREEVAMAFEEKFGVQPLEGYGCTELSPVAAVNIPDFERSRASQRGGKPGTVGHPLPGVFMKIVDPETGADLTADSPGLLLVKGPNVMKGYLGDPARTAQAVRDGYYATGDIGSIDADGFVTITDRLSRFSKIGGEMVPHVCIEQKLHELAGRMEQTFVVAGVPDARRGERLVVLYKDYDDIDGLCGRLAQAGLPKLWLPDRRNFRPVTDFPVLGTGKLDLQRLRDEAQRAIADDAG